MCDPEGLGVDALDGLTSLVDKSLIRRVEAPGRPARFSMLETIREFGLEQLEASGRARAGPPAPRRALPRPGRGGRTPPDRRRPGRMAGPLRPGARQHPRRPPVGRSRPATPDGPRRPPAPCGGSGSSAGTWPRAGGGSRRSWPCRRGGRRPPPGRRPWPGRAGSPGGSRTGRPPVPSTARRWPSNASSATPPASPRPCTTSRSWSPSRTSRPRPACSTRASSCSGQLGDEARCGQGPGLLVIRDAKAGAWDRVVARLEEAWRSGAGWATASPRLRPGLAGVRARPRRDAGTTPGPRPSRPSTCSARPTTPPGSPSPSWTWRSC